MDFPFILVLLILTIFILILPSRFRFFYTLFVTGLIIVITSIPAVDTLFHGSRSSLAFYDQELLGTVTFTLDGLSAFFILLTNFSVFMGLLYSNGYLKSYQKNKTRASLSLHYFSYCWLHLSMLAVLMLRDGLAFLIAWELMAVSSFMLILFDAEIRTNLKIAVNYLIQMHIGLVLLVIAFLIEGIDTGHFGFDGLTTYFSRHPNAPLCFLFFAGFAIKAGFIPFHTWLPEAHPAAPSHVSGVMSGVMIKMGIYGIVRVLTYVQSDFITIGMTLLIISALTGLYGVMMAIVQHDLKKLLAYHSIENIGIIGIGLGLGILGLGLHRPPLVILGFAGSLLHVLNHSLFKPLLFFSAGSVYKAYHTRNIEQLGGVIHKMPKTSGLFMIGALSICGLPPLNGFISEFLIYYGLIIGMSATVVYYSISFLLTIIALTLIGGLAIFCFTKASGIVFLGSGRTRIDHEIKEVETGMLIPQYLISFMIILIGFIPILFINPLLGIVSSVFQVPTGELATTLLPVLDKIVLLSVVLILFVIVLLWVRKRKLNSANVFTADTWGCGYTAATTRQQYSATSYAANYAELAHPVLQEKTDYAEIHEEDIFPGKRSFAFHPLDIFKSILNKITDYSMLVLKKIARLQTGNIQHYILYAFIFILVIFVLLYLELI